MLPYLKSKVFVWKLRENGTKGRATPAFPQFGFHLVLVFVWKARVKTTQPFLVSHLL